MRRGKTIARLLPELCVQLNSLLTGTTGTTPERIVFVCLVRQQSNTSRDNAFHNEGDACWEMRRFESVYLT